MKGVFESHAHYEDDAYLEDRELLLGSFPKEGIEYVVNVGSTLETSKACLALAERYHFIYAAMGIHPSEVKKSSFAELAWIASEASNSRVVAIGEIGLDYYWDKDNREEQIKFFEKQIGIAKMLNKPIIIHSRDAAKDTYEVMKAEKAQDVGGVVHCFSYGVEEAKKYLDMGFYIGLGGVVTFKNAVKAKDVAAYVPLDRLVLETDSPYMSPAPYRGKRNSSLNIPLIAQAIAEIRKVDPELIVSSTNENAKRMYRINDAN